MTPNQLATAVLTVLLAGCLAGLVIFQRGSPRRWAFAVLAACAFASVASWTDYGSFQTISVGPSNAKVRQHRPLHFHEFVHYYMGPKYFREVGYLGLYDCIALADREIADEDHTPARISGWIRDLDDVLTDKPYARALADCKEQQLPRFSAERWARFKADVRDLARLVDDGAWPSVVFDAGFNPPPSLVVVTSAVTNLIPIRAGATDTYLIATTLDFVLLFACLLAFRWAFGQTAAAVFAIFFGATFISHYTWNGGSVLRYTWFASIVFGLVALKRERWALAGALLGAATCDRLFPAGFAAGAMLPIAARALKEPAQRLILKRFTIGFAATCAVLFLVSCVVFDAASWRTFFVRVIRHGDVYYVMHIGLKKVLTYRDWVPAKNFHGHEGLVRFRDWNLRLRETWSAMKPIVLPLQALFAAATAWAAMRRRPWEAAMLGGIVFMFVFNLPANYYYVIVTPLPALVLRSAATTTSRERRLRDFSVFTAFAAFWMLTLIASHLSGDGIVYDFYICVALLIFLVVWLVAWAEPAALEPLRAYIAARRKNA